MCITGTTLDETVFAIPTDNLWQLITYKRTGLIAGDSTVLNRIVQNGIFGKRSELEKDPSFKQVIPYAIISNKGSLYLFRRTSGQTEKRLHNKLHLGVGGHMKPGRSKDQGEMYLVNELKRELFEEVILMDDCLIEDIEFIGFINDDSIPVGRVHIGLLYFIHVSKRNIVINETDKMTAEWINISDLVKKYEKMETWSRIAFDHYMDKMSNGSLNLS